MLTEKGLPQRKDVEEMIAEALAPYRAANDPPIPLIRLRVDYTGGFSTINAQRFGQKFVGKVANPNDIIQFHKSAVRRRKEQGDASDAAAARAAAEEVRIFHRPRSADCSVCLYSSCEGTITTRRAHSLGLLPRLFT